MAPRARGAIHDSADRPRAMAVSIPFPRQPHTLPPYNHQPSREEKNVDFQTLDLPGQTPVFGRSAQVNASVQNGRFGPPVRVGGGAAPLKAGARSLRVVHL